MPGSTPPTSQLDWLISITAMIVLFWSRATRDLLKSFGWGIAALHRLDAATKLPFPRRRPHSISRSLSRFGGVPEGLINSHRLAPMKRSAFLINIAPGSIVDEDAIYAALREGEIGGAARDVWWQYPDATEPERRWPSRHPFHELPNILMTASS